MCAILNHLHEIEMSSSERELSPNRSGFSLCINGFIPRKSNWAYVRSQFGSHESEIRPHESELITRGSEFILSEIDFSIRQTYSFFYIVESCCSVLHHTCSIKKRRNASHGMKQTEDGTGAFRPHTLLEYLTRHEKCSGSLSIVLLKIVTNWLFNLMTWI